MQPTEPAGETLPQGKTLENTFGPDERQFVTSVGAPWTSVGKLSTGCTATLIDQRLVLTAAHCILDPNGKWLANRYAFYPNMIRGRARDQAVATYVWYGTRTPLGGSTHYQDDWAILLLDRDLGTTYGWLGVKDETPHPGDKVTLTGYSIDAGSGDTATVHIDCNIQGEWDGDVTHDCDMTRGASGGPLWSYAWGEPPNIVGVQSIEARDGGETSLHLAAFDPTHANGAVPASRFFASLLWVIQRY